MTDTRSFVAGGGRLTSIDALRGLVILLMAVDHTRDFFTNVRFDPEDFTQGDTWLFLTRWITHFCAPVFVLLAGTSAGLMAERKSTADVSKFLAIRGLWLIFAELTLVTFGWQFNLGPSFVLAWQVIWVIGASMLVMAVLIWLPFWAITAFGLIVVFGHNALDYGLFPAQDWSQPQPFWHILHNQGFTTDVGIPSLMLYPLLPWIGVMPLGYALARLYRKPEEERRTLFLMLGLVCTSLFVILRFINGYGAPQHWEPQESAWYTVLDFFHALKYPPSLTFLLMTLGPGFLFLAYADRWHGWFKDMLVMFGRVPFFFYIVHIYLIHALAMVAAELQGGGWRSVTVGFWQLPADYGFDLWVVWVMWFTVIALLYPACKWFADLKGSRKDWWLSYL